MKNNKKEKLSRSPWQRILYIHEHVRAGEYPNCNLMAVDLEVSSKTLKRDVEFMRDSLNLPIEYDANRRGYFYTKPVDKFPGVAMTAQEIFALLVADKAIAQYQGTPFQKPLRMAFEKLTEQLDTHGKYSLEGLNEGLSFRPFAPEDTDLKAFQVISQALQEQRVVRFSYRNHGMSFWQERRVCPYHLTCIENRWYVFAYDLKRADMRTFLLTRLSEPEMEEETFEKPKDFNADDYLRGSFAVLKGDDDFEVVIQFDEWATDLLRGRQWHASQEFTELPNGMAQMRMRLSSLDEIERWVLTWGSHATVIKPLALMDRLMKTAAEVSAMYKTEPERFPPASTNGREFSGKICFLPGFGPMKPFGQMDWFSASN
jgi:predicted DNA-binding transcriptional regulator YafY